MQYVEALESYDGDDISIFLAGGITGCTNWQEELVTHLRNLSLVLINPRRKHFLAQNAHEQISWEFTHLRKATAISFWFPKETLCPITLYELGAWSMTDKKIFVGVDPDYQRCEDVHIQTALVRPDVQIVASVHALAQQIQDWTTNYAYVIDHDAK